MEIKPVAAVLEELGLKVPHLLALQPDRANYKLCLLQPQGDIEADAAGVRHRNADEARAQFSGFIDEVLQRDADLAVTPEYAMPWPVLVEAIKDEKTPGEGKLWAFGCESIRYQELLELSAGRAQSS